MFFFCLGMIFWFDFLGKKKKKNISSKNEFNRKKKKKKCVASSRLGGHLTDIFLKNSKASVLQCKDLKIFARIF